MTDLTGPPYPLPPPPSGIGQGFTIGVSQIGTPQAFDYWQTVISQYANSPVLTQLVTNFFQYLDQTINLDQFFDDIWNVDTAQGIGLDIWGRIVGVVRTLTVASGQYFGFAETDDATDVGTFGQAPFYSGATLTDNFELSDDSFRTLIFAKALANISNGSIPSINQLLLNLFPGRGNCYVTDPGGMTMQYVFDFVLSPVEFAIVSTSGVLPKPTGVAASVIVNG